MKYFFVALLFIELLYLLSFSKHCWQKKNRLAAIGSAIVGFVSIVLWLYMFFFGNYEL